MTTKFKIEANRDSKSMSLQVTGSCHLDLYYGIVLVWEIEEVYLM
jgi:hypothetical protein